MTKTKNIKKQNLSTLALCLVIVVLINIIASFLFYRIDLTSDKRYTLSPATKEFAKKIKDVVYVKVYLEGDFPPGFQRLRNSTKEMLDEFRVYSNENIEYEFIDPSANPDPKERNQLYQQLAEKGLQPTNLEEKGSGESSQKIIFPGAIFSYRSQEFALQLLQSQVGVPPEEMLNNSIQSLEYNIANVIKKLTKKINPKIGFIQGHAELNKLYLADIIRTLSEFYDVDSITIGGRLKTLDDFRAIVIAKPDSAFDEKDKFIIDQYIMKGGKVLWLVDKMFANMDSLKGKAGMSLGFENSINLDDMLFKYGVRINPDLVQDVQAAPIPIVTGYIGNQPQQKLLPWFYNPLIFADSNHPIVNNLNGIKFEFASSIDTLGTKNIKKTILLKTSKYSKSLYSPVRISLGILKFQPDPKYFNKSFLPLAVLLEGKFSSVYANRLSPVLAQSKDIDFKAESDYNKMIVVSDGDIIKNQIRKSSGSIYPLGYDRYSGQTYGNKSFLLNCIDYLCEESGLISVRSKELKLRLLNKAKVDKEKFQWIVLNTVGPMLLLGILGFYLNYNRRKKYAG